jgi:hypothetical protein
MKLRVADVEPASSTTRWIAGAALPVRFRFAFRPESPRRQSLQKLHLLGRRFCPDNRINFLFADYELTVAAAAAHDCQLRYSQKFSIIQTLLSVVQPAIAKCRPSGDCIPLVPKKLSF